MAPSDGNAPVVRVENFHVGSASDSPPPTSNIPSNNNNNGNNNSNNLRPMSLLGRSLSGRDPNEEQETLHAIDNGEMGAADAHTSHSDSLLLSSRGGVMVSERGNASQMPRCVVSENSSPTIGVLDGGEQRSLTGAGMHVSSSPVLVPRGIRRNRPARLLIQTTDDDDGDSCGACRQSDAPTSASPSMPPSFNGGDSLHERGLAALNRPAPPTPKGLGSGFPSLMKSSKSHHNFGEFSHACVASDGTMESDESSDSGGIAAALTAQRRGRATIARVSTVQNLTSWGMDSGDESDDGTATGTSSMQMSPFMMIKRNGDGQTPAVVSESLRD